MDRTILQKLVEKVGEGTADEIDKARLKSILRQYRDILVKSATAITDTLKDRVEKEMDPRDCKIMDTIFGVGIAFVLVEGGEVKAETLSGSSEALHKCLDSLRKDIENPEEETVDSGKFSDLLGLDAEDINRIREARESKED